MKIAIVCPIGDLNRFGYQRVAPICLESWRALGDLFLIHSSRAELPFSIEAQYIRNEQTLMQLRDGHEWFDYQLVARNANAGLSEARRRGYEVALTICVNWYIESALDSLAVKCADLLKDSRTHDFMYRRMQIKDQLYDADLKSIAIFNLNLIGDGAIKVLVDRAEINGYSVTGERGDFAAMNPEAYIDTELEVTDAELKDKLADIRNYEDILPKRHGASFEFWVDYFMRRKAVLHTSPETIGPLGQKIQAVHPVDSFGDRLL